jgi:hypothetical protein
MSQHLVQLDGGRVDEAQLRQLSAAATVSATGAEAARRRRKEEETAADYRAE